MVQNNLPNKPGKCIALFPLLFLGLMIFGCAAPQGEGPQPPAPAAPQARLHCVDGTSAGTCSATLPFFCTRDAELVEDSQMCGCPAGTIVSGLSCAPVCADGTLPGECSAVQPFFCGSDAQLLGKASACGCPPGEMRSGEFCIRACTDGTLPGECSQTQPNFCTETATLAQDPARCGCPPGKAFLGGECRDAACTDGTPMGACSPNLPKYCGESLILEDNAQMCGCPPGQILSHSNASCVNPRLSSKREDSAFSIGGEARLMARNSEYRACENGDYLLIEVRVENNGYLSDFTISREDLNLLVQDTRHASDSGWMEIEYPENDSDCSEVSRFRWGNIPPGQFSAGMIWYRLRNWDRNADYSLFYEDSYRIRLRPEYE